MHLSGNSVSVTDSLIIQVTDKEQSQALNLSSVMSFTEADLDCVTSVLV